jgi:hypothetical protein
MPLNIAASDKRLLLWAGVVIAVLIVVVAVLSDEEEESGVPTIYSSQSAGARAAYLLLKETGRPVERWEDSPLQLPTDPAKTTLILAQPSTLPDKEEVEAIQTFVRRGGRVLITGYLVQSFFNGNEVEFEPVISPAWKDYQPQLLTGLTQGGEIKMSPTAYWKSRSIHYLVHYSDENRPVVVSYRIGKGEVIWWAAATPLTNAGITASGNLALFLASVGEDPGTHVLWDEYFHSAHGSLGDYLGEAPIKYGLLQCLLFGLAIVLTYSRRNLPIHALPQKSRLSPLEFVGTLGGLYRRARASRVALEVPYNRFRTMATRQFGLRPDTATADLARALRPRLGYSDDSLYELMRRIETALEYPDHREKDILELVQQLNVHMQKLKFVQQETIGHANRVPGAEPRKN